MIGSATARRKAWIEDLGIKDGAPRRLPMWAKVRDQSKLDEATVALVVAYLVADIAHRVTSGHLALTFDVIRWLSAGALLAGFVWLAFTKAGRARVERVYRGAKAAVWTANNITAQPHIVYRAAGWKQGQQPQIVGVDIPPDVDWYRTDRYQPSARLPGDFPGRVALTVICPPSGLTPDQTDKLRLFADKVAEGYRHAFRYSRVSWTGDPSGQLVITLTHTTTNGEQAEVVKPGPPVLPNHPVPPDQLDRIWPALMTRIGAADRNGELPRLRHVEWSAATVPAVDVDQVLAELPDQIEGVLIPTPLQHAAADHDQIVKRLRLLLGYGDSIVWNHDPKAGGVPFALYRVTAPVEPDDQSRLSYAEMITPDGWAETMADLFDGAKVPAPKLAYETHGPVTPEPPEAIPSASPIAPGTRPEWWTWGLRVADVSHVAGTIQVLRHKLPCHAVTHYHDPAAGMVMVRFVRSPLPQGERVDLGLLAKPLTVHLPDGSQRTLPDTMVMGRSPGGLMVWEYGYAANPHAMIIGANGSGKGDALGVVACGGMLRDWLWINCNPKPNSDLGALLDASIGDLRTPESRLAMFRMARMEISYRAWLFANITSVVEVAPSLLTNGHLAVRDLGQYHRLSVKNVQLGYDPFPALYVILIEHDESSIDFEGEFKDEFGDLAPPLAQLSRSLGFHLVLATQADNYAGLGGPRVIANLTHRVQLRTTKDEILDALDGKRSGPQASALTRGPGRGHNFHTSTRIPGDPFSGLTSFVEGQTWWMGDDPSELWDAVAAPYLARNPEVVTSRHRDWVKDCEAAEGLFGKAVADDDFSDVDLERLPYILGPRPLLGPHGLFEARRAKVGA